MLSNRVVRFILFITLLFPFQARSQTLPSVHGQWIGTLTQEQGGYRDQYTFEIYFQTDENTQLAGTTYVWAPGVLGVFSFNGSKRGKVYYITENELRYSRKPEDLSWCFKTMQLRLIYRGTDWYLEGPWQGTSGYGTCIPGWLSLKWHPPKV